MPKVSEIFNCPIMKNPITAYSQLPYEKRIVINTAIGMCFSAVLACAKFIIGLFSDYELIGISIYSIALLLSKAECLLGIKSRKRPFKQRNLFISAFLFAASLFYIAFMGSMFFVERRLKNNEMTYVLLVAFISFTELGLAIYGLFRTKNRGHYYRNIKIINLCSASIAILTTQMVILNMQSETDVINIANAYTGIGVGCFIALCAVYIMIAPKASVVGREHAKFMLTDGRKNAIADMKKESAEITLCKSAVYGDYVFRAKIADPIVEGDITRSLSLWKRMHIILKILCCILSEILIFVWLIGRLVLFFRSINLPDRLKKMMLSNGFAPCKTQVEITPSRHIESNRLY